MRIKIVFGLLLLLTLGLGVTQLSRDRVTHTAPQAPLPSPSAVASASAAPRASGSAAASASGSASAAGDAGPAKLMDRPLRAITLGWDLAAPAILQNGGLEPAATSEFSAAGVEVKLNAVDAMSTIEGALARGGADRDGADVAVIPFCEFVAAYERLRALSPEAFFVVGWSRGREALISTRDALPAAGDKPEGKPAPGEKPGVAMVGVLGEPATFLGLFALDAGGIPPGSVRLVAPGGKPDDPPLAAVDRGLTPSGAPRNTILLTTADASRLIPFVAVAQHGLLEKNGKALTAWARVWLEGTKKLESDPPAAARQIAAAPGAPEPIALLKRLGELTSASLPDNARAAGLSGRGALSLEILFQRTWQIWRAAGVLATPAPETAPINTSVIAQLVRSSPALAVPPRPGAPAAPGKGTPAGTDALRAMIIARQPEGKLDEPALQATAGFLADVFERSAVRVAVIKAGGVDGAATKRLIDEVEQRFDVAPGRLSAAKKARPSAAATVEVLAAP